MIEDTLNYLYNMKRFGIKLDLTATRHFADHLGNPQNNFRSIHVAGTNGKGSISTYIYSILRQKYNTGLYTSPHLINFNERLVFNKEMVDDEYIEKFMEENMDYIKGLEKIGRNPTFFETTTVMAFKYFSDKKADYASIEVGLGGRLDSTNIINPEVSVIAQIGYEHFQQLGCSLTSIAYEKGGIIKNGKPVVLLDNKPEVVREIKKLCEIRNSKLIRIEDYCKISDINYDLKSIRFKMKTEKDEYDIEAKNTGLYQIKNIASSISAIEALGGGIDKAMIINGIRETNWPGRFDVISTAPLVIMDSAHNPPAAHGLVNSFKNIVNKKPLLIVGMLSDKDVYSYFSIISELSDEVILTIPDEPERAMNPEEIKKLVYTMFREIKIINDPIEAYEYGIKKSSCILVTGSIYLVGMLEKHVGKSVMPYDVN